MIFCHTVMYLRFIDVYTNYLKIHTTNVNNIEFLINWQCKFFKWTRKKVTIINKLLRLNINLEHQRASSSGGAFYEFPVHGELLWGKRHVLWLLEFQKWKAVIPMQWLTYHMRLWISRELLSLLLQLQSHSEPSKSSTKVSITKPHCYDTNLSSQTNHKPF